MLRDNRPACAFYERLGGATVGERVEDGLIELAVGWRDLSVLSAEPPPAPSR